jgi:hypothetical protein
LGHGSKQTAEVCHEDKLPKSIALPLRLSRREGPPKSGIVAIPQQVSSEATTGCDDEQSFGSRMFFGKNE